MCSVLYVASFRFSFWYRGGREVSVTVCCGRPASLNLTAGLLRLVCVCVFEGVDVFVRVLFLGRARVRRLVCGIVGCGSIAVSLGLPCLS